MDLILFFGRFHPLLVHLPIGFLMLAVIFEITDKFSITKGLKVAVPFTLLLGALSGVVACVLGLMLATEGDYNDVTLNNHKWAGIATTIIAGLAYLISTNRLNIKKVYPILLGIMMLGLTITGHLGGNMTHGETYLTEYMPFQSKSADELARPKVTDLAQAQLFGDIVHPIIKKKCMSCHNSSKQKGKLSFASIDSYLKGGKHGSTIVGGDALKSELLVRVNLDPNDEEFMPTDGKTPLTDEEITMLTYWIANANADFDTLFLATEPDEKTIEIANQILELDGSATATNLQLPPVQAAQLQTLTELGFTIRELVAGSNAYDVVLPPNEGDLQQQLTALSNIKDNILWLTLEDVGLQNADLSTIATFKNLKMLKLSKNPLNDENWTTLSTLEQLESLNLYGTNITAKAIEPLSNLPNLQRIYIWQAQIQQSELKQLQEKYPNVELIAGM